MSSTSTLSARGLKLASGPNMRDKASQILSKQWHPVDNPDGTVNIGTAENHLMFDDVAEFIRGKDLDLKGLDFDYGEGPWGSTRLRTALANFMNAYFNPHTPIDAEHLTCANGCTALFNMLSLVLGDPGDGILLSMPSYIAFASDFGLVGKMKPVNVSFGDTDQFSSRAITCYERALQTAEDNGTKVCALMLCNPHNPVGRCYPTSTLIALLRFCSTHRIHLISDEIYAMSVYATLRSPSHSIPSSSPSPELHPFTSILSLPYTQYIDPSYLHVLYGMSKDFASGGLRIGCLYTHNKELSRALSAINSFHWPGQIDQIIAATMLEDSSFTKKFLETSRQRLGRSNRIAKELLDGAGIEYAKGANAGFFLWVDLSAWLGDGGEGVDGWEEEKRLHERLIRAKVFLTAGRGQASEKPGWFRLVFSHRDEVLSEGIKRLVGVLKEQSSE